MGMAAATFRLLCLSEGVHPIPVRLFLPFCLPVPGMAGLRFCQRVQVDGERGL